MPALQDFYEQLFFQAIDLYTRQKYYKSLAILDKLILFPDVSQGLMGQIYRAKGDCLCRLERYQDALLSLNQALFLVDKNARDRYAIFTCKGWCLYKLRRYQEALRCYEQAVQSVVRPEDVEIIQFECELILAEFEAIKKDESGEREKAFFRQELQQKLSKLKNKPEQKIQPELEFQVLRA